MSRLVEPPQIMVVSVVDHAPVPEPRGHPYIGAGGRPAIRPGQDANRTIDPWKEALRLQGTVASLLTGRARPVHDQGAPLVVSYQFWLPRPEGHFRTGIYRHLLKPTAPPYPVAVCRSDLDNLIKAAQDALGDWKKKRSIAWHDDAQIVGYDDTWKRYADDDHPMGVTIIIEPAPALEPGNYDSRRQQS